MIGWLIYTGQPTPAALTYAGIQSLVATAACMMSMGGRRRREMVIAHMLDTSGVGDADSIRLILRTMQRFSTPDQRKAGLDYARYQSYPVEP